MIKKMFYEEKWNNRQKHKYSNQLAIVLHRQYHDPPIKLKQFVSHRAAPIVRRSPV